MKDTFRTLLNKVKDGLLDIGMSIDIEDHGSADEAKEVYERGRSRIQNAVGEASAEDCEVFNHLFGFKTDFNKTSWSMPYEYILELLNMDPEISLDRLRNRRSHFLETIENLKSSSSAIIKTILFRFTRSCEPSLLREFRLLIAQKSGPPGWYYDFDAEKSPSFHFSLEGDGLRVLCGDKIFEYDLLLHDVWVHCLHPMRNREQEVTFVYEDTKAGNEIKEALIQIFSTQSWEPFEP